MLQSSLRKRDHFKGLDSVYNDTNVILKAAVLAGIKNIRTIVADITSPMEYDMIVTSFC